MSQSAPTTTPVRPRATWPWAVALVLVVGMVCGALLAWQIIARVGDAASTIANTPARLVEGLAGAFKPTVNVTTTIDTTIGQLKHNPKLVVLTADVDAEVSKASATTWAYIYLGTTTVTIRTRQNKVQWFVPLETLGTADFVYDPVHKRLTLLVPPPRLDEEVVSVQSDPAKVEIRTSNGWAKLDRWSGAPLREEAQRELRPAVLKAGGHELLQTQARVNAREHIKRLLSPLAAALEKDVELEVQFREQPASPR